MKMPLYPTIIPIGDHPGSFGAVRKYDVHTGVDLYCCEGASVYAIEDGVVVNVCDFTGPIVGTPWWNDTRAILVEGKSGVFLYGEVQEFVDIGDTVVAGQMIGHVKRVLTKDKGKPMDMLHLELYTHGYRGNGVVWELNANKPELLLDPTTLVCRKYEYDVQQEPYTDPTSLLA